SGNFCFIEWPEMITELLPEYHTIIKIEVGENEERILTCEY
ncbi:MAG: tRNA (adenosine(37)-N6)-threonylcarbamoyltransferase complex ATPase subunit type 1 TsaE, partial [Marinilabiliales bacterium]